MKLSAAVVSDAAAKSIAKGNLGEALALADRAIEIDPGFALAYCNRGLALNLMHRHEEAVAAFERSLECDPTKQAIALNLADSLEQLGRHGEALQRLNMAHLVLPYAVIKANLATAYYGAGDFLRAEMYYRQAIEQDVDLVKAHSNLAICYLMQGKWREGWEKYCWRFAADGRDVRECDAPPWDGESIRSVLVLAEQGVGEEILWLGILRDGRMQRLVGKIWWEADPRLHPLISRSFPEIGLVDRSCVKPLAEDFQADAAVDAADLGRFFRNEPGDFLFDRGEYLRAERSQRLAPFDGLTVGISWHSTTPKFGPIKSLPLSAWEPLLSLPGVRFIDLQYGERETDSRVQRVEGLDTKDDLDGLASLICECDVVLTISNTTAHLAGALGIPCWVMLPPSYGRFWYWGTGDRSVWYPSVKLFQNRSGWPDLLERVRVALNRQVERAFLVNQAPRHV